MSVDNDVVLDVYTPLLAASLQILLLSRWCKSQNEHHKHAMACKDDHTRKNIRVERARTGKFFPRRKGRKICTHPFPPLYSRPCFGGGMMLASSCNGEGCGTRRQRPCAFDCKCLPCYNTGQCLHELKRKQEGRDKKGKY